MSAWTAIIFWRKGGGAENLYTATNNTLDDFRRGFTDRDRSKLEKSLRGLLIKVTHRSEVKRRFKIVKLTPTPANKTMFMKEESQTDVATYFHETYGRKLAYPFMPCVVTGRDVFLPMEICFVIPVSSSRMVVDFTWTMIIV